MEGLTDPVVARYLALNDSELAPVVVLPAPQADAPGGATRLFFLAQDGAPQAIFRLGESWRIVLEFEIFRPTPHVIAAVGLVNADSVSLVTYWSKAKNLDAGTYTVEFTCDLQLKACDINFAVGLSSHERAFYYAQGIGHVTISQVAFGEQPFRAEGAGLLLSYQESEILHQAAC